MRIVLVTGTSTGIGREAVHHLVAAGCHVIATARTLDDIRDLSGPHVDIHTLDVTDESSMVRTVDEVMAKHGRIDALVNNAGFGTYLPVEETEMEQMRAVFEVNLFGLHRLTQLVLPYMHKQGSGRIVNVSSVAGHLSFPMLGIYCASKFAVRAMTQAMHGELKPLGIHGALIEPGRIRTSFGKRAISEAEKGRREESPYHHLYARFEKVLEPRGKHPKIIAKRIAHACTAKRPRFHYLAPWDARTGYGVSRLVPDRIFMPLTRRYFWKGRRRNAP